MRVFHRNLWKTIEKSAFYAPSGERQAECASWRARIPALVGIPGWIVAEDAQDTEADGGKLTSDLHG
jgi:hypothetical protein